MVIKQYFDNCMSARVAYFYQFLKDIALPGYSIIVIEFYKKCIVIHKNFEVL